MEPVETAPVAAAAEPVPVVARVAAPAAPIENHAPLQLLLVEAAAAVDPPEVARPQVPEPQSAPVVVEAPAIELAPALAAASETGPAPEPEPRFVEDAENATPVAKDSQTEPVVEPRPVAIEAVAAEQNTHTEPIPVVPEPEPGPIVEPDTEPVAAAQITHVEPEPPAVEPVAAEGIRHVEPTPVATEPERTPVVQAEPQFVEVVAAEQPPPVEATPVAHVPEPEHLVEPEQAVAEPVVADYPLPAEATPVATEPEQAPVAEPAPVSVEAVVAEQTSSVEATLASTESEAAAPTEPEPVAAQSVAAEQISQSEVTPVSEPALAAVAKPAIEAAPAEPVPAADLKPPVQDSDPACPIKLHEVPDPLFALAVEIRAVQAARAAALAAPHQSSGLLELADAVGVPHAPVEHAEHPSRSVQLASPAKTHVVEAAAAVAEAATAVALLAPPEPEKTQILEPQVVALAPVPPLIALAPEPIAHPEPVIHPLPETQPEVAAPAQPAALTSEPETEPEGPTLPFAPMQDYTPATSRSIMPVPPPPQILSADSGPRITLPGPKLPPELTRLQDANVVTVIGEHTAQRAKDAVAPAKRGGAPGWLVSTLVMLVLLGVGLTAVFYLLPHTVADAKPGPTPAAAATTPTPTGGSSPLAKFIEVTGFRIVTAAGDANKKSEVQYLVVNHSDADISDANVFITLRSAKPGQAPLCRFSFKVPSLGPFESKEMSSPIEKSTRVISLPDWQDLRADVQISQ